MPVIPQMPCYFPSKEKGSVLTKCLSDTRDRTPAAGLERWFPVSGGNGRLSRQPPPPPPECYLWGLENIIATGPICSWSRGRILLWYIYRVTGRPSNFLGNDKASVATLCKISSFIPKLQAMDYLLGVWGYIYHSGNITSRQRNLLRVGCVGCLAFLKMTLGSFFFLINLFRCYVHSANSSGRTLVKRVKVEVRADILRGNKNEPSSFARKRNWP